MKRFSKKLIPYYFVSNIIVAIFIYFFVSSNFADDAGNISNEFIKLSLLISLIGYVFFVLFSILYYFRTGYELREKEIICVRGVLLKKESILEYSKIHAVNKKQGLIQRLFGISTLTIDSGSTNTSHQAEIIIIENDEVVLELMEEIKQRQSGKTESDETNPTSQKENLYKFTAKTKFIYTLLNCVGTFVVVLILSIFISIISKYIFENVDPWENGLNRLDFIIYSIGIGLVVVASVALGAAIISFIQYHDFKIYKTNDEIEINYGLLTKHQNTFKLNRIKGIRINQGVVKRLFGFATINLEVIGYSNTTNNNGEENKTIGVLIPLCKYKEIDTYLDKILPNYKPEEKEEKALKLLPFVSYFLIFSSAILLLTLLTSTITLGYYQLWTEALMTGLGAIVLFLIFIGIVFLNQCVAYKNNGINICDKKVTIYRGGLVKEVVVILKSNIIGIEKITTHHRNKEGINSYIIHFKSNATTNTVKVCNLSIDVYEKLLNLMTY